MNQLPCCQTSAMTKPTTHWYTRKASSFTEYFTVCCLWISTMVILLTVPVGMGFLCDEDSEVEKTSEKSE